MSLPTALEIERFIHEAFAPNGTPSYLRVEAVEQGRAALRWQVNDSALRPGATVSGPTMMTLADTTAWALIMHRLGLAAAPSVTSSMNIHFLKRPARADLLSEGTLLKLGRRLAVVEVAIRSEGAPEVVAHATVTYAIQRRSSG